MPDLDDLILTLDRLHDVLGERPALWRTTTGIEVTQAIQHHRSREHLTDPADRAPDNAATLVAYKAAIVRAYVRPPIGKSTGDAVGGTLLVERQDGIFGGDLCARERGEDRHGLALRGVAAGRRHGGDHRCRPGGCHHR